MWLADLQRVDEETSRVTLKSPARALSFAEVFELWRGSAEFRDYFTQLIGDSVFEAFLRLADRFESWLHYWRTR